MTVWGNGLAIQPTVSNGGQFGAPRGQGRTHAGADFIGYSELRAIEPGRVTFAGVLTPAAGVSVAIDLPSKIDGHIVTIVRMHIKEGSLRVSKGSHVVAGQLIGLMGDSGNTQGKCDHVEVRLFRNGALQKTVDPVSWIARRIGGRPAVLSSDQRVAKAFVNGRTAPTRQAPIRGSLARASQARSTASREVSASRATTSGSAEPSRGCGSGRAPSRAPRLRVWLRSRRGVRRSRPRRSPSRRG
jgi:hypothetical protein